MTRPNSVVISTNIIAPIKKMTTLQDQSENQTDLLLDATSDLYVIGQMSFLVALYEICLGWNEIQTFLVFSHFAWFEQFGLLSNIFKPVALNPIVY